MLFDIAAFRTPLPAGVQVFASGANRLAEIRGFARLGIPVGVSVNHLNEAAVSELIDLQQPVMIDSGAFSEVAFGPEGAQVVSQITDHEWRRRLGLYLRLASSLHTRAMLVVPDQVGNQDETLRRLRRYRTEIGAIATTGATLLLPLQVGPMSHTQFLRAAELAAGIPLVPAMPMRKATTSATALIEFVQENRPQHIHLLGMGIDNHRATKILRLIQHFSPGTAISLDSNRIRAVTGDSRPLTLLEAELRAAEPESLYGEVDSRVLDLAGVSLDYTDLIAFPSSWCTALQLSAIALAAGMLSDETERFYCDPDGFLQTPFRDNDELLWIEHPLIDLELNRAWEEHVELTIRGAVRTAAIVSVFQDSPARRRCA